MPYHLAARLWVPPKLALDNDQPTMLADQQDVDEAGTRQAQLFGNGDHAADARFEDVAATLGADRWTTFRRVTLPMVAPGVAAGAVLCWARALGEFGATITFAGNFPGTTQTMPLAVYLALQRDPESAIVLSLVLLAVSLATLLLLRDRWLGRSGSPVA